MFRANQRAASTYFVFSSGPGKPSIPDSNETATRVVLRSNVNMHAFDPDLTLSLMWRAESHMNDTFICVCVILVFVSTFGRQSVLG